MTDTPDTPDAAPAEGAPAPEPAPAPASPPAPVPAPATTDPVPAGQGDGPVLNWVWMDDPANVQRLLKFCYLALGGLVLWDAGYWLFHHAPEGEHHALVFWQDWPLGYALYGGIGCAAIILACKMWFGPLLKRKEGYYD